MGKLTTTEEFIEKAKKIHDNKYDYSKVEYINNKTKVCIICKEHGEFWKTPSNHLQGQGCIICSKISGVNKRKRTIEDFICKANIKHNFKYDYSKVNYINDHTKIEIICKNHGSFLQTPNSHLSGRGCPKCGHMIDTKKRTLTLDKFIERANIVHNNYYTYDKTTYVNMYEKVIITCPIHGDFEQKPNDHLGGCGCTRCNTKRKIFSIDAFIEESNRIHNYKYDYSKVVYKGRHKKVCIICSNHGEFWQSAGSHLRGSGCPKCKNIKGELKIEQWLKYNNIFYKYQHKFEDCKNIFPLPFDFYIPSKNLCIEYDGEGHFKPINWSGKMTEGEMNRLFENYKNRDEIKNQYCKNNNINLLRIPYTEINNIESILEKQLL